MTPTIDPKTAHERRGRALLIDVRTPVEHRELHAEGVQLMPLDQLDPEEVRRRRADGAPVYVLCRSGSRAAKAVERLCAAGLADCHVVAGGTEAWAAQGLPVVRGAKAVSLERQVRIVAGSLVLIGAVLASTVHIGFVGLSAFVGAGLVFAGVTDWCGMGLLLARMPWNRVASAEPAAAAAADPAGASCCASPSACALPQQGSTERGAR